MKRERYSSGSLGAALVIAGISSASAQLSLSDNPMLAPNRTSTQVGTIPGSTYYESLTIKTCHDVSLCVLHFKTVPADFWLKATHINCFVNVPSSDGVTILHLVQGPLSAAVAKEALGVRGLNPEASIPAFTPNEEILSFFEGKTQPLMLLNGDREVPSMGGSCKLSGTLVKP